MAKKNPKLRRALAGQAALRSATANAASVKTARQTVAVLNKDKAARAQMPKAVMSDDVAARRYAAIMRSVESDMRRQAIVERWSHKNEGTAETHEHFNSIPSRRRDWPLARMARLGKITADELAAAHEIASIVEIFHRSGAVGCASMEARVDYAGSAKDALIETLGRIRMELAYRGWREAIPEPKSMILDMIMLNVPYVVLAKQHRLHWRTARKRLMTALRLWPTFKILAKHEVAEADVFEVYQRIGEGVLMAPKPRNDQPAASLADGEAA
jgi:hypothetical protein